MAATFDLVRSLALLTLAFVCSVANSMRFELQSGNTKCISEDIKTNAMSVGKYSVVNPREGYPLPDSHRIVVKVTSSFNHRQTLQFPKVFKLRSQFSSRSCYCGNLQTNAANTTTIAVALWL